MTRRRALLVALGAGAALAALAATAGGTAAGPECAGLLEGVCDAYGSAQQAENLTNSPWTGRLAGLGIGLAVGLLFGGLGAFAYYRRQL